jgi:hypothetical protein
MSSTLLQKREFLWRNKTQLAQWRGSMADLQTDRYLDFSGGEGSFPGPVRHQQYVPIRDKAQIREYQGRVKNPDEKPWWVNFDKEVDWWTLRRINSFIPSDYANNLYAATNETLRQKLVYVLGETPQISVGKPTGNYLPPIGWTRFCFVPKGNWPMDFRTYAALFSGCISVHLSDEFTPAYDKEEIDWEKVMIKIPERATPRAILKGVLAHLHPKKGDGSNSVFSENLEKMQAGWWKSEHSVADQIAYAKEKACWVDYTNVLDVDATKCSPYKGIVDRLTRLLESGNLTNGWGYPVGKYRWDYRAEESV